MGNPAIRWPKTNSNPRLRNEAWVNKPTSKVPEGRHINFNGSQKSLKSRQRERPCREESHEITLLFGGFEFDKLVVIVLTFIQLVFLLRNIDSTHDIAKNV